MRRAKAAGVTNWAEVEGLSPSALEARLYPSTAATTKPTPDCAWIHRERRRVGVTLQLLHLEYVEQQPDGYRYSQFCEHYRRWLRQRGATMRQVHQAGEKTFVDYSGKKPCIWDEKTGERIEVELFVAVLGASNFTYAEATRSQRGPDWIGSHTRAFAYFGGVTAATVCDQLKPGVTLSCRYEPGIQRTYEEMAEHYGTTVLPARPWHPRDKPKVEGAVLIVQRWILARLLNETHFSLGSLNARIAELLEDPARQLRLARTISTGAGRSARKRSPSSRASSSLSASTRWTSWRASSSPTACGRAFWSGLKRKSGWANCRRSRGECWRRSSIAASCRVARWTRSQARGKGRDAGFWLRWSRRACWRRRAHARRCIWRFPRPWRSGGCRGCSPSGRIDSAGGTFTRGDRARARRSEA